MVNIRYLFHIFECGHFCVKRVLKMDRIKLNVSYNRQMMSLGLISRVLKEYYQAVECYHVSDIIQVKQKCITLLNFGQSKFHYVVIEKIRHSHVYYYDPFFVLKRKVKINKFVKKWTGYCCFFSKK